MGFGDFDVLLEVVEGELEFGEFLFGHWDACIIISTRIIRQLI
jgi:hypothetical protein